MRPAQLNEHGRTLADAEPAFVDYRLPPALNRADYQG